MNGEGGKNTGPPTMEGSDKRVLLNSFYSESQGRW